MPNKKAKRMSKHVKLRTRTKPKTVSARAQRGKQAGELGELVRKSAMLGFRACQALERMLDDPHISEASKEKARDAWRAMRLDGNYKSASASILEADQRCTVITNAWAELNDLCDIEQEIKRALRIETE